MSHLLTTADQAVAQARGCASGSKLEELQLLRAIAAGFVVWAHALDWAEPAGLSVELPASTRAIGAAGVDLFFVISGFIITRTTFYGERRAGAAEFVVRRILRIVPLYWFWSAVVYVWQTAAGNAFAPAQIAKTLAFFPWVETNGYVLPVLYLGWTLSYELFFYLTVGVALIAGARRPHALIVAAIALGALSFVARSPVAWVPFVANPLWLEFAAGAALAMAYPRLREMPRWFGSIMIAAGAIWWGVAARVAPPELGGIAATLDNSFSAARVAWWGGGAVCLTLGAIVTFGGGSRPALPRVFIALGDASYTWYLTQALTLPIAARVWSGSMRVEHLGLFSVFAVALTGAIALGLARIIEFPLHRCSVDWARRRFRTPEKCLSHARTQGVQAPDIPAHRYENQVHS